MKTSTLSAVPFYYTYRTRLTNVRGLLDYVVRDVAIPIIPIVLLAGADVIGVLVLLAGFLALYEVGYLLNDRSTSAGEEGGDRMKGDRPPLVSSLLMRGAVFSGAVLWCGATLGWGVAERFLALSVGVLGLLIVHTFVFTRWTMARMFSFATLALAKYAPPVVTMVAWDHAVTLLSSVFLMYGLPRTIHYVVRKMSTSWPADRIRTFQDYSHGMGLFPGLVIVIPDLLAIPERGWTIPAQVWVLYAGAWLTTLVARRIRRS